MKPFPVGFYWGASSSAYQVEGDNDNTDWHKAAEAGLVPPAGRLADHYHRYEEDFDIAKELGHNTHRLSIEWARIEPREGEFDEAEINHYRAVLQSLKDRNLEPLVTLWHFTLPLWFSETGGFERRDAPELFARYSAYVTDKLGDLCHHFSTMNEPNVFASNGWLRGAWPPFKRFAPIKLISTNNSSDVDKEVKSSQGIKTFFVYWRVMKNLAAAHNSAFRAIKATSPKTKVSVVKHVIYFHANWNPVNKLIAWGANYFWTHIFMRRTHRQCDLICLNYYFHKKFGDQNVYKKTDMGWDVYPEGIYGALKLLQRYKKPLMVAEAGVADAADRLRAAYIKRQVAGVHRAIDDGLDIRGHFYWSLIDNYEWALGIEKRFGLVEIDYQTLKRTIRLSAWAYKKIIEVNGQETR